MNPFQKTILKIILGSTSIALSIFLSLFLFSKASFLWNHSLSDSSPDPLHYESIGNYPEIDEVPEIRVLEKEFTLEISRCKDKTCIEETLQSLAKNGIDAFYTPTQQGNTPIFCIRRGIFSSRRSAERAKAQLEREKNIRSRIVEL